MAREDSKIRLLAVERMLLGGRPISTAQILRRLELEYDITADRKTVYDDIRTIDLFVPIHGGWGPGAVWRLCAQDGKEEETA